MIVFDTHVWLWWLSDPDNISSKGKKAIERHLKEKKKINISCISSWEVALLEKKGRIQLAFDVAEWIQKSVSTPFFNFVPIDNNIAIKSINLRGAFHSDPADRIIVATALTLGATLITKDEKILQYPHVKTLW